MLLDLFCKAGGAAMGYHMAGFEVVGVDIHEQLNYPFRFVHANALKIAPEVIAQRFQAVHASPPCQAHTALGVLHPDIEHPDLIEETRQLLRAAGLPYIIENVPGAPLEDPVVLCGSSFGLRVRRHRLFECSFKAEPLRCDHQWQDRHRPYTKRAYHEGTKVKRSGVLGIFGHGESAYFADGGSRRGQTEVDMWRVAMGIDWMTRGELAEAIPPLYTRYLGRQLMKVVRRRR